jgi:hypothetical protein
MSVFVSPRDAGETPKDRGMHLLIADGGRSLFERSMAYLEAVSKFEWFSCFTAEK